MFYIFDALEIIMGPFDTEKEATCHLRLHVEELYLEDYYPNPCVDYIDEEGEEYEQ